MPSVIEFTRGAVIDFDEAHEWYETKDPGTGRHFARTSTHLLESIAGQPFSFSLCQGDFRKALMKKFPYAIAAIFRSARDLQRIVRFLSR